MLKANVLDTFAVQDQKIFLKNYHIDRTFEAYQHFFPQIKKLEIEKIYNQLESELKNIVSPEQLVRLMFAENAVSHYRYEIQARRPWPEQIVLELIESVKNPSGRGLQNYKWQDRSRWDNLLAERKTDAFDILAQNKSGQITETSRCNIFIYDEKSDHVFTPTLDSGCINGVYRRFALNQKTIDLPDLGNKNVLEKDILAEDLHLNLSRFNLYLANSVRGVLKACLYSKNQPPKI